MGRHGIKKAFHHLTYHILPSLFWLSVIFGFDAPYVAVLTVLCAALHEIGHITALIYVKGSPSVPKGHITGFRIKRRNVLSYKDEALVLAAGPIANILFALFSVPFIKSQGSYALVFFIINASTAISNLLPCEGYDGYGILYQIFESKEISTKHLENASFLISILLTFFSLYLIGRFGEGYWIFFVFFISLSQKIAKMIKFNNFKANKSI